MYKQPVFFKIEPNKVDFLSKSAKQNQSLEKYYFRCEIGTQSIGFINDNCSPGTVLSSLEDTINVLLDIYLKGLSVKIKDWIFFEYIVSNGKIIEINQMKKIDISSYCFGVFGDLQMVESSLKKKNRDLIFLNDEIFIS